MRLVIGLYMRLSSVRTVTEVVLEDVRVSLLRSLITVVVVTVVVVFALVRYFFLVLVSAVPSRTSTLTLLVAMSLCM